MLKFLQDFKRVASRLPGYKKAGYFYRHFIFVFEYILPAKLMYLRALKTNRFKTKTILAYPQQPPCYSVIYKIAHILGYRIKNESETDADFVLRYEETTFPRLDKTLLNLSKKYNVINFNCNDVSKNQVDYVFNNCFGYSLSIDPLKARGRFIRKSNFNSEHDGTYITCPIDTLEDNYIYQKPVNNLTTSGLTEDIRTPVFKDIIPFVYLKYRTIQGRFLHENVTARIAEVNEVFSQEEVEKIRLFCKEIGLDFCELDILRDKDDGRLYIIDANNTPSGPPNHISKEEEKLALKRLSLTFEKAFKNAVF